MKVAWSTTTVGVATRAVIQYSVFRRAACRARRHSTSRFARAGPLHEIRIADVTEHSLHSPERSTPATSKSHSSLTLQSTLRATHDRFPAPSHSHRHTRSLPQPRDKPLSSIPD